MREIFLRSVGKWRRSYLKSFKKNIFLSFVPVRKEIWAPSAASCLPEIGSLSLWLLLAAAAPDMESKLRRLELLWRKVQPPRLGWLLLLRLGNRSQVFLQQLAQVRLAGDFFLRRRRSAHSAKQEPMIIMFTTLKRSVRDIDLKKYGRKETQKFWN